MIPCYYESQPGGCTKPMCPFLHTQPKLNVPPPAFSGRHNSSLCMQESGCFQGPSTQANLIIMLSLGSIETDRVINL